MRWLDNLRSIARPREAGAPDPQGDDAGHARRLIAEGNAQEERGDFARALRCYERAAQRAPTLPAAPLNRGNALLAMDRVEDALAAYAAAIALDPDYAVAHYNRGNAQMRLGQREAAVESYRIASRLKPDFADAEVALGNALEDLGRLDDAVACFRRALAIRPEYPEVQANLGQVLARLGRTDEAAASFRRALDASPDLFAARYALAMLLRESGQKDEALAELEHCLRLQPDHVDALTYAGDLLLALGRKAEAVERYRSAIAIDPLSVTAHNNLGNAHAALAEPHLAIASFSAALAIEPDHAEVLINLGSTLVTLARIDEAIPILRRAVERAPEIALGHFCLGTALYQKASYEEAMSEYHRALELDPRSADSYCNLGSVLVDLGRHEEGLECFRRALEINPEYMTVRSNVLFVSNYIEDYDAARALAEVKQYGEIAAQIAPAFTTWQNDPDPGRRLRVGIVSADLRRHAVGHFAEGVVAAIAADAAAAIDVHGYYNHFFADALTERIRAACRGWCGAWALTDEDLANRIREDRIDILIDLSGHTAGNRLLVFARKPAPVQATWLGYWATTGIAAIDYLIADRWTLPEDDEASFTERIWRLPETRLCFSAPTEELDPGPSPALTNGFVTYGSFNRLAKLTDDVVALWARVLSGTPDSRLLLKAVQLGDASVREEIVRRFARCGVDARRLTLEGESGRAEYLATYRRVDIALDPFPFPGGATSAEALWMGVPVLTLAGDRFIARQGVSLLMNVGLPEWVAADPDDYVARAVAHAADRERLAALRGALRQQALASPAFDAPRFARHFAAALRGMWRAWCSRPQP